MHRKSIWVLAAILTLVAGCAPKVDASKDVAAIKALATAWDQAETAGDAAALSEQFADGAVRLAPNGPIQVGKEAMMKQLSGSRLASENRCLSASVDFAPVACYS